MNKSPITTALKARLADGGVGIPGAWPNIGYNGALPYFEATFTAEDRTGNLKGAFRRETGTMAVIVAVEVDTGTDAADAYADAVAALFPGALRLTVTGGVVTISGPPTIKGGYRADSEYRVPVMITYSAIPT